ncbi:MAG: DUF2764 family protein [Alistipes sp.]|nr:DUF2764 family protein [Alistipes sp.]
MFANNYYALVAGLREYALDADTKGFDAQSIVDEILEVVSKGDAAAVRLLYTYYDCENLANLRNGSAAHNALGNLSREEIEAEMANPTHLPQRIANVIRAYANPEGEEAESVDVGKRFEKSLFEAYYEECACSSCRFLREWSSFDRTLRNILAAAVARSQSRPIEEVTIGGGDVVEQLQRSSAADFGLRGEYAFVDGVISAVNDEQNLLEKERKIDLIRWNEAGELSTFDYFDINAVMAYLVKVNMVARWSVLDVRHGREMFERLLADLDGKDLINK